MIRSSERFQTALRYSHRVVTRVDVLRDGAIIFTDLPVSAGTVTVDRTASFRRRLDLTVPNPAAGLIPTSANDLLAPYGNELAVRQGIGYPDGSEETVPLGVFRLSKTSVRDRGSAELTLSAYDRSRTISAHRFEVPYVVQPGQNYATEIGKLADNRLPGVDMRLAPTGHVTPLLVWDAQADPMEQLAKMAASIGQEILFDVDGVLITRAVPDVTTSQPVFQYRDDELSVLTEAGVDFDDDPGYNGVIVSGESTSNSVPARGEAWDLDPASPTYSLGRYGRRPRFETSQFVTSDLQAANAAAAMLRQELGVTEQVTFSAVPNPGHDAGDVGQVVRGESQLNDVVLLESVSLPLGPTGEMTATTRKRRAFS